MKVQLTYTLSFETASHVGAGLGFARMVDELVVRAGPARGQGSRLPYVPGTTLKGRVRREVERLAAALQLRTHSRAPGGRVCKDAACLSCRLFGSTFRQGSLYFSEAFLDPALVRAPSSDRFALAQVRAGTRVERATRCVERKLLFSRENAGAGLVFQASVQGYLDPRPGQESKLPLELWLLLAGLRSLEKVGGGRTRGLGRCDIQLVSLEVDGALVSTAFEELFGLDEDERDELILGVLDYAEADCS
ncbi:MAG: RAMP superfamily CRISPR-associated protein [Actinomycetota bacterium]